MLATGDGNVACDAANAAIDGEGVQWAIPAEHLFMEILKLYNELTTEKQIVARVEAQIAPLALQGASPSELADRRAIMKGQLRDRRKTFDDCYRQFFFVDRYPDNAKRFILSFDRCFQEATNTQDGLT